MKSRPNSHQLVARLEKPDSNALEIPEAAEPTGETDGLRRLEFNELVSTGDFVLNEQREFEEWEGPNGFRADSFVKPIYRRKNDFSIRALTSE